MPFFPIYSGHLLALYIIKISGFVFVSDNSCIIYLFCWLISTKDSRRIYVGFNCVSTAFLCVDIIVARILKNKKRMIKYKWNTNFEGFTRLWIIIITDSHDLSPNWRCRIGSWIENYLNVNEMVMWRKRKTDTEAQCMLFIYSVYLFQIITTRIKGKHHYLFISSAKIL